MTWRIVKNSEVGHQELLVVRSDKESEEIYRKVWLISEDKE